MRILLEPGLDIIDVVAHQAAFLGVSGALMALTHLGERGHLDTQIGGDFLGDQIGTGLTKLPDALFCLVIAIHRTPPLNEATKDVHRHLLHYRQPLLKARRKRKIENSQSS